MSQVKITMDVWYSNSTGKIHISANHPSINIAISETRQPKTHAKLATLLAEAEADTEAEEPDEEA